MATDGLRPKVVVVIYGVENETIICNQCLFCMKANAVFHDRQLS